MKTSLMLAGTALLIAGAVTAQTAAPADQPAPAATVTPVQPEAAAPPVAAVAAPDAAAPGAVATADSAVTRENGKYVKDGRPATRTEIASYKRASKSKPE